MQVFYRGIYPVYSCILWHHYYLLLRISIDENIDLVITLSKQRSRRYPVIKITDADYADDLVIFADPSRNAEKWGSLEKFR